ncbi:MAG: hypothetical protein Q8S43_07755 [Actinomycetota bacterium]|nr:hypothetical protein [Actinomycetota bacterium]MDP3630828.1 hypothetical protein [Actinomycetota bacterium]
MAGLYLVDKEGKLTALTASDYISEERLQRLLADYPDLLGGDQMGAGESRQWLFVKREAPVPDSESSAGRWSLDHLFLDQDAIPTFVEVKRASDTRIRREVVGQMLDYAANGLRYWPVETVQGFLAVDGHSADDQVLRAFGSDLDTGAYWTKLRENMAEGRIRLLFVADRIPDELKAVVEFLNRQMDHTEVLAVEIPQYTGGEDITMLAPRVFGLTQEAIQRKGGSSGPARKWDEASFFEDLAARFDDRQISVARRLYDWMLSRQQQIMWGQGKVHGSLQGRFSAGGRPYYPVVCYTYGSVEVQFYYMSNMPPFDDLSLRREFAGRLNAIPGVELSIDDESLAIRRPSITFETLAAPGALDSLFECLEWFRATVEEYVASGA